MGVGGGGFGSGFDETGCKVGDIVSVGVGAFTSWSSSSQESATTFDLANGLPALGRSICKPSLRAAILRRSVTKIETDRAEEGVSSTKLSRNRALWPAFRVLGQKVSRPYLQEGPQSYGTTKCRFA
jgi:hypothetical protein